MKKGNMSQKIMSSRITCPLSIVDAATALLLGITDASEVGPYTVLSNVLRHEGRYNMGDFLDFIEEKLNLEPCVLNDHKFDISMTISQFADKAYEVLKDRGAV